MGFWDQLFNLVQGVTPNIKLLVVGLDNSGKTTILRKLHPREDIEGIAPTIGAGVETFYASSVKIRFTCFDMSGQSKYRQMWDSYIKEAQAIIYVIDSTDRARFEVARHEFREILTSAQLRGSEMPILVMANKMDCLDAADPIE